MYSIPVVGAEKRASKHVRQPVHLSAGHTSSIYSQSFAKPQPAILVGGGWPARGVRSAQDLVSLIQDKVHQKSKSLRTEFRRFDEDFSGTVSRREFRLGLAQMGIACADDEFERLLAVVDQDGGGSIDYGEFAAKLKKHELQEPQPWGTTSFVSVKSTPSLSRPSMSEGWSAHGKRSGAELLQFIQDKVHQKSKSLRTEFRRFDKDFSGTVSRREFRLGLAQMGIACADDEFERLLAVVDQDSGGSIDYGEFAAKLKAADAQTHNFFGDSSRRHELQEPQRWGTTSCAQALSQGPSTHMSVEMCDIDSHEDDSGKTMVVPLEATQVPS